MFGADTAAMKFSKVLSACLAAGVLLSGCSLFSASLDDKWFPADVVAPVGLPIYEVTPKAEHVPFFDTADQVSTVADLLEVDVEVVQASVDESLEIMGESAQFVVVPISCDLPVESSLAAASFLHPGYVWESTEIEAFDLHAFGIDLAPGFDEVANTATASWDVTGSLVAGVKANNSDGGCSFSLMDFRYDFEVVGYTEVSRSVVDARADLERFHDLLFDGDYVTDGEVAAREDIWQPARLSYIREIAVLYRGVDDPAPYLVHPSFFIGDDEMFGVFDDAYIPVDPEVAAAEIRFLKSQ